MRKRVLVYILAGLLLIYFLAIFISQEGVFREKNNELEEVLSEIQKENEKSEKLREEKDGAGERETIEDIAREELGLVYPEEKVYVDSNS